MSNRLRLQDGKTLTLASLGGALEFYDFIVFLTFAPFLQILFFPGDSPLLSSIMTYLTYAVAYFVRPLSGVVMAHFGDIIGRKRMFMLSLFLMAIPTLLIGLLPTYEQIGYAAPVLLLIMRLLQGIALGGEVPSAHVFVTEHVPHNRMGLANSMIASGLTFGVVIGHFAAYIIYINYSHDEILSFAWRYPFICGGILGLMAVYLRRYLRETPVFLEMKKRKELVSLPIKEVLKNFRGATLISILTTWLLTTGVVLVVLAPNLMKSDIFKIDPEFVSKIAILATIMNVVGNIIAGIIADRAGIRKTVVLYSLLLAGTSYAFFDSLSSGDHMTIGFLYSFAALFLGLVACVPIIIIKLFPANIRLSGIGFSYNIGNALFAGLTTFTVPVIAEHVNPMFIAYYILFLCALGLFISFCLGRKSVKFYV
ncbi:MFS transporter [Morganella psychrotolerans]|uniref:Glycine/betaine transporter n=1 Tax=Morganella psychrotolerans TaxID=368603 RepID=A0A1B8HE84_9GAMM|nr:MFS transporter [Morganella psychrotolerans]OBU07394.1 glycine/betaine transporter [Morganella psychrotolerans]